jgi:hypothetical protein
LHYCQCKAFALNLFYILINFELQSTLPVVIICTHEDARISSRLYSAFLAISVVFLAFTLIAFFVAPEMQNLQGKSIASQSAYLMIAYVALILSHLRMTTDDLVFCKILGNVFKMQNLAYTINAQQE